MEEEQTQIILALSHDAAVAVAAAVIHYNAWARQGRAPTMLYLDEVYDLILQQPQLSEVSRAMLQDMKRVAEQSDEEGEEKP